MFVNNYWFGYSAIKLYKEDSKKIAKKKVVWENMAVINYSHHMHILFTSSIQMCNFIWHFWEFRCSQGLETVMRQGDIFAFFTL